MWHGVSPVAPTLLLNVASATANVGGPQSFTLTASGSNGTPTGSAILYTRVGSGASAVDTAVTSAVTLSGGQATFSPNAPATAGSVTYVAKFTTSNASNYNSGESNTKSVTVALWPTTMTLAEVGSGGSAYTKKNKDFTATVTLSTAGGGNLVGTLTETVNGIGGPTLTVPPPVQTAAQAVNGASPQAKTYTFTNPNTDNTACSITFTFTPTDSTHASTTQTLTYSTT